jgi:hypothetical protein
LRKDSGNLGFVTVGGRYVRFAAERKSYHRISQNAVVKVGVGLEVLSNEKNYLLLL